MLLLCLFWKFWLMLLVWRDDWLFKRLLLNFLSLLLMLLLQILNLWYRLLFVRLSYAFLFKHFKFSYTISIRKQRIIMIFFMSQKFLRTWDYFAGVNWSVIGWDLVLSRSVTWLLLTLIWTLLLWMWSIYNFLLLWLLLVWFIKLFYVLIIGWIILLSFKYRRSINWFWRGLGLFALDYSICWLLICKVICIVFIPGLGFVSF